MNQFVTYRQNAAECYEAARIPTDPRQKAKLLVMADSWESLADHAERNSHFEVATTGLTNHGNGWKTLEPPPALMFLIVSAFRNRRRSSTRLCLSVP